MTTGIDDVRRAEQAFSSEAEGISQLCEINGLSKEDFVHGRLHVQFIEAFLTCIPSMCPLRWFPAIRELHLLHCGLVTLEGLENCVYLEKAWLNENDILEISGLDNCTRLQELYLYSNQIKKIQGLDKLTNLEVLWLQENQIKEVEGLGNCTKLRNLSLAANQIESIYGKLDRLTALVDLNVAANNIGSFRDIPYLGKLTTLRNVWLSDAHFGTNPVCQLCNYQTYVIYQLRSVTQLDGIIVSDDLRHVAEATFVKKKMYYNMRIKTLKRNCSILLKKGSQFKNTKVHEISLGLNVLLKTIKTLERELGEQTHLDVDLSQRPNQDQLKVHLTTVGSHVVSKKDVIDAIEEGYQELRALVTSTSQHYISRLMLELQTGGNIRLEDGRPEDIWYKSCVDLVRSRFFSTDFGNIGIQGVKVVKVTRIHNRFLRNQFEGRLENVVDTSDPSYKRSLEYLFYGEGADTPGELLHVVQGGFRAAHEYEDEGIDCGIPLSNSVFVADQAKLTELVQKHAAEGPGAKLKPKKSWLLVAKVFLGRSIPEREDIALKAADRRMILPKGSPGRILRKDYAPQVQSVYRTRPGDMKTRVWYSMDHHLILPEYLVEIVYEPFQAQPQSTWGQEIGDLHTIMGKLVPMSSESDASDMKSFAYDFVNFMQTCNTITASDKDRNHTLQIPYIKERPKHGQLSSNVIQTVTGSVDLSKVVYANLMSNSLKKMAHLQQLTAIQYLILSFNEFQEIEGLGDLPYLHTLDLSFNLIKRLHGLQDLPSLTKLDLNNNLLQSLDDVLLLNRYKLLEDLNLASNPVCEVKSFKNAVLRALPHLTSFDAKPVTEKERKQAMSGASSISGDVMVENGSYQLASGWSNSLRPFNSQYIEDSPTGSATGNAENGITQLHSSISTQDPIILKLVDLNLSSMKLRKIQSLNNCRNLRRLNLSDNEIIQIEGLEGCLRLEELNLDDNCISKIEGLSTLGSLRKLELGRNAISQIEGLETLSQLQLLSLEDNCVSSLDGFTKLPNLMELYMSNNRLDAHREVLYLRDIDKLIIVDFGGNAMCKDPEYRLFTIYTLKKLKVLDGLSVDSAENAKAKDAFTGKVTPELLAEKIGHGVDWVTVTELNLMGCGIKEMAFLERFPNLLTLRMDRNSLSDLNGIQACTLLKRVELSSNKFSASLDNRDPPQRNPVGKYLSALIHLEHLTLGSNSIQQMHSLQLRNPNLTYLSMRDNEIQKLSGFDALPNLRTLVMDKNKIRNIDPRGLAHLANLQELRMEENAIRSLDGLGVLMGLIALSLNNNRIAEPGEIDKLRSMDRLQEVWFQGNSLARKVHYRTLLCNKLPSLVYIDGKEVTGEERDKGNNYTSHSNSGASVFMDSVNHAPTYSQPLSLPHTQSMGGKLGAKSVQGFQDSPIAIQALKPTTAKPGSQRTMKTALSGSNTNNNGSQRGMKSYASRNGSADIISNAVPKRRTLANGIKDATNPNSPLQPAASRVKQSPRPNTAQALPRV